MRLVMVHGTRSSAAQWEGYDRLLAGHEVVPIDLPGHGARDAEAFTWTAALAAIHEACGTDHADVVVVGHSLGGYLAAAYAATPGAHLRGLALLGATADPSGPLSFGYGLILRGLMKLGPERTRAVSDAVLRVVSPDVATRMSAGPAAYAAIESAWSGVFEHSGPEQLRSVSCPTLLLNGQFDQMRINVRRYASAAHNPTVGVVPRATHLFPITHRAATARHLRAFVDGGSADAVPGHPTGRDAPTPRSADR